MIGITPVFHALGGGPLRLVGAGVLSGALGFTRASSGLALGTDGVLLGAYAAGVPRFQGAAQRLLVEGARTNTIRNPRVEGAVAGSPGTVPTNWTVSALSGTTRTLDIGTSPTPGLPFLSVRIQGTPTAAGYFTIQPEVASTAVSPAAVGQVWTFSCWVRLAAGSLPAGSNHRLRLQERGGATTPATDMSFTPGTAWQRIVATRVLSEPGTTYLQHSILPFLAAGTAADLTLQVTGVQAEAGGFVSSPILPAVGSSAASGRVADVAALALGTAQAASGSLVGTFMLPAVGTAAGDVQGLLVLDDGTDGNRFGLVKPGGGAALVPFRSIGGSLATGAGIQTLVPGTAVRVALAWSAGGIAACCNGGAVVSLSGAIPAVSRLLIGHGASSLGQAAFGEAGPLDLHPTRLPDAGLQALTLT